MKLCCCPLADHPGVPNAQLVKEQTRIAVYYKNQSIAEQNSVDLCWDLLMDPKFKNLRETIYSNDIERRRFRQLVVNSVMATDIVDKELKALRNARWDRAFREAPSPDDAEDMESNVNRKATSKWKDRKQRGGEVYKGGWQTHSFLCTFVFLPQS